jgi:hypothetical protein
VTASPDTTVTRIIIGARDPRPINVVRNGNPARIEYPKLSLAWKPVSTLPPDRIPARPNARPMQGAGTS